MSKTLTVSISGLTCGHCVASVTEEIEAIAGVDSVDIDLNSGGTSTATITSVGELNEAEVSEAVAEAGYTLISNNA